MKLNKIIIILLIIFFQSLYVNRLYAKEPIVTFIDTVGHDLNAAEQIKSACDLMGVGFKTHFINTTNHTEVLKSTKLLIDEEVLILTGRALNCFNKDIIPKFGQRCRKTKILILYTTSNTDNMKLKILSENKVKNIKPYSLSHNFLSIRVAKNEQISKELGGLEYPITNIETEIVDSFELSDYGKIESLINVAGKSGELICPIFLKTDSEKRSVFYLTSWEKIFPNDNNRLLKIMPILMFLKYSFGDRCWHGLNDFANLTIDDPWLREPYGYIRFEDLCREAKTTPFHATIAFIPYNYKKSHDDVIEIFRQCSQNLSIAVHGNNHDFTEFRNNVNKQFKDKEISSIFHPDEKNIIQALYRMETFTHNTGIPYDRVMIFPRGVFTKESLELLKKQNFLMTVNGTKPFKAGPITDIVDRLREITLEYKNFPMVLRYGLPNWNVDKEATAETKRWIQMRLFLNLPVLLYTHHSFFKNGADSFNSIANFINDKQPEVSWANLGTIANHLYLQKRNNDHEIEIMAYSSNINIKNNYQNIMTYIIKKQEDFSIPIKSVEVNGLQHEFTKDGNKIKIEILLKPNCEENIRIIYRPDNKVEALSYSNRDLQVYLIRSLSDFRDNYLSKLPFGDKMVTISYRIGGLNKVVIIFLGIVGISLIMLIWYIKKTKEI